MNDALDQLIAVRIAAAHRDTGSDWTQWEAGFFGFTLFTLVVRQVEAVVVLARHDLVSLAPAVTIARAAVETSVRLWWMCAPEEPFVREARWVALAREQERFHGNVAKKLLAIPDLAVRAADHERERLRVATFLDKVTDKLRSMGHVVPGKLTLSDMLADLGESRRYLNYISASQFVHGTLVASELYHRTIALGEFVETSQWRMPLSMCSAALDQPVSIYLDRYRGGDTDTAGLISTINGALGVLGQ